MRLNLINFEKFYSSEIVAVITARVSNAVDMLDYVDKFNCEQETEGVWQQFTRQLQDTLEEYEVTCSIDYKYFKSFDDVIIQIEVSIFENRNRDCKVTIRDEKIAGTVFSSLFKYLDMSTSFGSAKNLVHLVDDCHTKDAKKLLAFQRF